MFDMLDDLSILTTIPKSVLEKLTTKSIDTICYDVREQQLQNLPLTEVDIGIGILYIKLEDDAIMYKFVPSEVLENKVLKTVNKQYKPVCGLAEASLKKRIMNAYKELF